MVAGVHTAIEDELQLDELHVNKLRVDGLMGDAHADMFHLDQVALQGVVEAILEDNEVGNLRRSHCKMEIYAS